MRRFANRTAVRLALLAAAALALQLATAGSAPAAQRVNLGGATTSAAQSAKIARYWTPRRMRQAQPLDGGPAARGGAQISSVGVADTSLSPYRMTGRIFLLVGRYQGYCSGTAINTPTRQLVLTAGHCLYDYLPRHRRPTRTRYLDFVPAYANGQAPFGEFTGAQAFMLRPWLRRLNENFDMAAVLTNPNALGQNLADAVGGGADIALDQPPQQQFQLLGYPGFDQQQMQECDAPYVFTDRRMARSGGPPSIAAGCYLGHGASGGPWFIAGTTTVNGMTTYGYRSDGTDTYGPYFSSVNVGALIAGR